MAFPRIDKAQAEDIASISPGEMAGFLAAHGWTDAGLYARGARLFRHEFDDRVSEVIVPTAAEAFDYGEWMCLAIDSLAKAYGAKLQTIVTAITSRRSEGYHAFIHYGGDAVLIELSDQIVTSDGSVFDFFATDEGTPDDDPVEKAITLLADSMDILAHDGERIVPQREFAQPTQLNCLHLIIHSGNAAVQRDCERPMTVTHEQFDLPRFSPGMTVDEFVTAVRLRGARVVRTPDWPDIITIRHNGARAMIRSGGGWRRMGAVRLHSP